MPSESITKRSHGYDVWFAEERTWQARVTCPAPAELYPGEKGPFRIFDCLQKNLVFCRKMWYFSRKIRIYYEVQRGPRGGVGKLRPWWLPIRVASVAAWAGPAAEAGGPPEYPSPS